MLETKNHIALSRKYRPKNLEELIGQNVLVQTLSNAIKENKLAQSYLLTGIRGIGKTTTARIIAKTINCENLDYSNKFPKSCDSCNNCISLSQSNHPDILEIDAASRTGVDDIRIIIESAEYKPLLGKVKIFIIDEVHMLSKNAFNALLKVLEEPPLHTMFIFATTEVNKIPLTIISRCQRFDLKRLSIKSLIYLLENICQKENIKYEDSALLAIAAKSDGSARDSLSLLDQASILANSSDNSVVREDIVEQMTSAVDKKLLMQFLLSISELNPNNALDILREFYSKNTDFTIFLKELLSIIAYIAKKHASNSYIMIEFHNIESDVNNLLSKLDIEFSQIAWQLTFKTLIDHKNTTSHHELLEMLALKLIYVLSNKLQQPLNNQGENSLSSDNKINSIHDSKNYDNTYNNNGELKKKFNIESYLKKLYFNKEIELYYNILNYTNFEIVDEYTLLITIKNKNKKLQNFITNSLNTLYPELSIDFKYQEDFISVKNGLIKSFLQKSLIQKISKTFSDVEIIDILMSENK